MEDPPPKNKLFRKEELEREEDQKEKTADNTQKMPANDKEDTPKIQHMHESCLQREKTKL